MGGRGTHKWSSAPTEGCGKTEGMAAPWRSRRGQQGQSCTFLLCPGTLLPALGQRDQYVQKDGGVKGPTQNQHSWTPSGCVDELERLRGADGKESCLSVDLELLPECVCAW